MESLQQPHEVVQRVARLEGKRAEKQRLLEVNHKEQAALQEKLDLAKQVEEALEHLSGQLFKNLLNDLQNVLSKALQDVLEQPLILIAEAEFKRGGLNIEFMIEREGEREHIMHGQGGSVANVLSVGLRMFALSMRKDTHRQILVLDEPDCWLQPELVPRLVRIIKLAGQRLGIQVLLISHHHSEIFAEAADRIHRLIPTSSGVQVELLK